METAPWNCRFLSLVVVESVLTKTIDRSNADSRSRAERISVGRVKGYRVLFSFTIQFSTNPCFVVWVKLTGTGWYWLKLTEVDCKIHFHWLKIMRVRQRSGEGVVRRNGRPKGCFWRVRFFSASLRFSGTFRCLKSKPQAGREETDSPKTPFWTTVSPHDAFAAPLARSEISASRSNSTPTQQSQRETLWNRGNLASETSHGRWWKTAPKLGSCWGPKGY